MKSSRIILLVILLAAAGYAGVFYYKNLRGVWPAFKKPSQDIAKLLDRPQTTSTAPAPQNLTDFPLTLPPGFSISAFAKDLGKPRVMAMDPIANVIFVSIPSRGQVVGLFDGNRDGIVEERKVLADGLNRPHGIVVGCDADYDCAFYVAETDKLVRYDYETTIELANKKKLTDLPDGGSHFTRTILFVPRSNKEILLISVGSSCNVCDEKDSRRAAIYSMNPDGSDFKEYARGLRNAVFMAAHPVTGKLWVTEMGRDLLGDDLPPDEINVVEEGNDYGWPYCYGKQIHDVNFDPRGVKKEFCKSTAPPHIDIPAHSAPLGLAFVPPDSNWPKEYWYNLLVAYHGSWNRSVPTGYKIVRYKLDRDGNFLGEEDFITGWLTDDGEVLGRPVDILIQSNGVMYISDDKAGVIYRVEYRDK